jgi:hypothetical protein
MGNRTDNVRARNPRLARAFELYLTCRSVQLFHIRVEKDKGRRVENKVTEFVTGYSVLPEAGGVLDQPVWLMAIFDFFKAGENAVAAKTLS